MKTLSIWTTGPMLCRGDGQLIRGYIDTAPRTLTTNALFVILVGCSGYGAVVGLWRAPLLAGYVAVKLPALILFTTAGNALLNGMLAPLLGIPLTFRQSSLAILCSFALASVILASLAPIAFLLVLNAPSPDSDNATQAHQVILLFHTIAVGFSGVIANLRLLALLEAYADSRRQAKIVLAAWLGGNMLLGTQLSWIMRPFFGTPSSPVEFLRPDALDGNFFESVFRTVIGLLS